MIPQTNQNLKTKKIKKNKPKSKLKNKIIKVKEEEIQEPINLFE